MSVEKKYIIKFVQGVPGDPGPQGPQGPGNVGAPTDAASVTVTNPGYDNVQEVLDDLLFVPIVISSFTVPIYVFEQGSTVTSLTFSWALNRNAVSQVITGTGISTPVSVSVALRTATITVNLAVNGTYTLTTTDENGTTSQKTLSINFYNGIFTGDSVIPGAIDSSFIRSLSKKLQASRATTWTIGATGTQYNWFACRTALGTPVFTVGGFDGGFTTPTTVSFTNGSGYTEDYYVFRSVNPGIGPGLAAKST